MAVTDSSENRLAVVTINNYIGCTIGKTGTIYEGCSTQGSSIGVYGSVSGPLSLHQPTPGDNSRSSLPSNHSEASTESCLEPDSLPRRNPETSEPTSQIIRQLTFPPTTDADDPPHTFRIPSIVIQGSGTQHSAIQGPEWFRVGKVFIVFRSMTSNTAPIDNTQPAVFVVVGQSASGTIFCLPLYHRPAINSNEAVHLVDSFIRVYADDTNHYVSTTRFKQWARRLRSTNLAGLWLTTTRDFNLRSKVWINCGRVDQVDPSSINVAEVGSFKEGHFCRIMRYRRQPSDDQQLGECMEGWKDTWTDSVKNVIEAGARRFGRLRKA